jgi:hypothetical protein
MPTEIKIKEICSPSFNLIIKNCCESLIEEIISFDTGGLPPIGAFVDDEGNCWTLVDTTEDPITSIREISNSYGSCVTCLNDNPCPENYVVESCCATFNTIFSSTLPGVGVGDTFADTFGFCWTITGTTAAPINGVVSVDPFFLTGSCSSCLLSKPCPDIYSITSCCPSLCKGTPNVLYTTLQQLGGGLPGETFVDQFGFCWAISTVPADFTLLTGSFIQHVTTLTGTCEDNAETCFAEICDDLVYYTIQNCSTNNVEIVQAQFGFPVGSAISINFTTNLTPACYEIISWDLTSLPTLIIDKVFGCSRDCITCKAVFKA